MARQVHDAVILSGASQSSIVDCGSEYTLVGIEVPAAWTAADITLLGATHTGKTTPTAWGVNPQDALEAQLTFKPVYLADGLTGVEYKVTAVPTTGGALITIPDGVLEGVQFLKVRSGTAAAPVVQGADRNIRCVLGE